jgi:transposase-like protein/DNA-directed RNA polymerase subunit M/transcription elongation factor TFIIS
MSVIDARQERGQAIAQIEGAVKRIDDFSYEVRSQSGNGEYEVLKTESGWLCSCPDFVFRPTVEKCKHIWAVEISIALRKRVEESVTIKPIDTVACPFCKSNRIVKNALRHNALADIQRYKCKNCGKRFSFNLGFEKMHATPQVITSAMQLYFTGESFRGVRNFLELQGVRFSHQAVYNWVKKYTALMERYLDEITPQVGDTWRTDELYVKIKGNMKYLFAMMDDETRFRIAQQVADNKGTSDVRPMFKEARERAGKKPKVLISDGAHNFHEAYVKEYWSRYKEDRPEHIRDIRFGGQIQNNKMERQNGEVRDREKVMRGLKRTDTPVLKGYQIFHNYFRPHEGLEGKTPAEACGIRIEGKNKWITVIQNASHDVKKA